jgi:hypothetical protein
MLESEDYKNLFVDNKTGEKVLQELTGLFFDRLSYTKNDPYDTAFKEGQRSVVEFMLQKIAQINFLQDEEI